MLKVRTEKLDCVPTLGLESIRPADGNSDVIATAGRLVTGCQALVSSVSCLILVTAVPNRLLAVCQVERDRWSGREEGHRLGCVLGRSHHPHSFHTQTPPPEGLP